MLPTKFQSDWPSASGETKIEFQDGGHLGFQIRTILAIFDLQVIPMLPATIAAILRVPIRMILAIFDVQVILMLPTKFQVNWPFGSLRRTEK